MQSNTDWGGTNGYDLLTSVHSCPYALYTPLEDSVLPKCLHVGKRDCAKYVFNKTWVTT